MSAKPRHKVLSVNEEAGTLVCAICGEVRMSIKAGIPKCSVARRLQSGDTRHRPKDGLKFFTPAGYIRQARGGRWIMQHRLIMEDKLGRALLPGETVHHINGVKHDNRPENLELWLSSQPAGQRVVDLVAWAKEILATYDS